MLIELIKLPSQKEREWEVPFDNSISASSNTKIIIDTYDWELNCNEILKIENICKIYKKEIYGFKCLNLFTVVSAKYLGHEASIYIEKNEISIHKIDNNSKKIFINKVVFHEGTIRSGENIESEGNLMIQGDVNPGAIVSANGNIMIWGRLLGIAHAGKSGNYKSKISALNFRPVQLRIADLVARGPSNSDSSGLAEQAEIHNGVIVIKPLNLKNRLTTY